MDWDIIGHEWAVQLLQKHLENDRVRHAYLFSGPPGIGRRTLALRFAQSLNCTQPPAPGRFCGECRDCRQTARMAHPDLAVVQVEEGSTMVKVDQIRELQRSLSLSPYQGRYRVALLLGFEQSNPNAANALLKTLEEPPPKVVLILTAESGELLLPTIVSRCEVLRLQPVTTAKLDESLQARWAIPPDDAKLLAHVSRGRPGYAYRLSLDPSALTQRANHLESLLDLLKSTRTERWANIQGLVSDKENFRRALLVWISYWHDVLLRATGSKAPLANPDRAEDVLRLANQLDVTATLGVVRSLERTLGYVDSNVNDRLAAEVLMLDLPLL